MVLSYCSSLLFSTNHLRSLCLSFLLLAMLFTIINFLTTTTTIHKLTTAEFLSKHNATDRTTTTTSIALLSLNPIDVQHRQFHCYERTFSHRSYGKKMSFNTIKLHQPHPTSSERDAIPYDYDIWQSAPLMPRSVSKCEHNLMMELLKRFDQLTNKYSLEYMMTDGTLLGSWRHHDLIPWDDDIDLLMSVELKDRLNQAIQLESTSSPYVIEFYRHWDAPKAFEYYKFYFSISPRFTEYPWRYPFVDLIFYHENQTHLWQENMQDLSSFLKENIFPLKYRPLGPLWLPAPRSPHEYFLSVGWTTYDQECFNGPWSHKYERTKDFDYGNELQSKMNCQQLQNFYPFVQRSLRNQQERLIINGTVKQIIQMIDES